MDSIYLEAIKAGRDIYSLLDDDCKTPIVPALPLHKGVHCYDTQENSRGLIQATSKYCQADIFVSRLPVSKIAALMILKTTSERKLANIGYSKDLNTCWARFVLCKELAHVALSKEENKSSSTDQIDDLITGLINGSSHNNQLQIENIAYWAATEMLLPKSSVDEIRQDYTPYNCDELKIAKSYKVPVKVIQFRLTSSVDDIFEKVYKELSD
ncbi:MAG: ImmA/IrrE family metallo-endopeptidase [Arenicella sp.]